MTCQEMYLNGTGTGMERIQAGRRPIRRALLRARAGLVGAVAGAIRPATSRPPFAATTPRPAGTTVLGSVSAPPSPPGTKERLKEA